MEGQIILKSLHLHMNYKPAIYREDVNEASIQITKRMLKFVSLKENPGAQAQNQA